MNKLFSNIFSVVASFVKNMRQKIYLYVDLLSDDCIETVIFYVGASGDRISILRRRDRYILRIMAFEDNRAAYIKNENVVGIYSALEKCLYFIDASDKDFSCIVFGDGGSNFEISIHRVGSNIYLSKHDLSVRFRVFIDRKSVFDAVNALRDAGFI